MKRREFCYMHWQQIEHLQVYHWKAPKTYHKKMPYHAISFVPCGRSNRLNKKNIEIEKKKQFNNKKESFMRLIHIPKLVLPSQIKV